MKKNFSETISVLQELIGASCPPKKTLQTKCTYIYGRYTKERKHLQRETDWARLLEFIRAPFYAAVDSQPSSSSGPAVNDVALAVDHTYGTLHHSPVKRNPETAIQLPSPKKLRHDCATCTVNRASVTELSSKLSRKKSAAFLLRKKMAAVKRQYGTRAANQRNRRHKNRISDLLEEKKVLQDRVAKLKSYALSHAQARRKLKTTNSTLEKKIAALESELTVLKSKCSSLTEECRFLNHEISKALESSEKENVATKEGKTYNSKVRQCVYFMLCQQVPVGVCGPVMQEVVSKLTMQQLPSVPSTTTSAQMAYELGIISSLQVASLVMEEENVCLSWDATSIDGNHVNEIHLSTQSRCLTLDVKQIAGGKAADYSQHVMTAFSSISALYSRFMKKDDAGVLSRLLRSVTCTVTDRAPVNSAAVKILCEQLGSNLIELHCNVHPLDAFAKRSKAQLTQLDSAHKINGKCYGKEGAAGNLIQAISKMRYKAGTGDPEGFKSLLRSKGLPLSCILRYVGNRLHVLMHSAAVVLLHKDMIVQFLKTTCTASTLRLAILTDLDNGMILDEIWALAVVGKFVSGPWMTRFYTTSGSNISMVPVLQAAKLTLEKWSHNCSDIFTEPITDVFEQPVDVKEPFIRKILAHPESEFKIAALNGIITGMLTVFDTQLAEYTSGHLSKLTQSQKSTLVNAPVHNMQSERALALLDCIWRRAPNATPGFLSGKIQCKLNQTLKWLHQHQEEESKAIIRFAVKEGYKARRAAASSDKDLHREVELRRRQISQKRDITKRNQLSKKIFALIDGHGVTEGGDNIPDDVVNLINKLADGPDIFIGLLFTHVWEEDNGTEEEYMGRIREVKSQTKSKKIKLRVSYWSKNMQETDGQDYLIPVGDFFADMALGDLVIC